MKDFNGLDYTRNALLEEFALVERHARDGSAVLAGCSCIEEKHLLNIAGLASEGVTLATDPAEKEYYFNLANWARERRREILDGDFKKSQISQKSQKVLVTGGPCEVEMGQCLFEGHSLAECKRIVNCHA